MSEIDLDQLADKVSERQQRRRLAGGILGAPEPMPGSFSAKLAEAQEKARQERFAAAQREVEQQRAEHAAEEARLLEEWRAKAPEREAAQRELERIEAELETLNDQKWQLLDRARPLRQLVRPPWTV
jgi:hypothetical protein